MKNLQVALDERLHQRLKIVAANSGQTLANLIRQAVGEFVVSQEAKPTESNVEDR